MRWALVVVVLCGACEPQGTERKPRWPHHRQQEEQRISDLETEVKTLHAQLDAVQLELRAMKAAPVAGPSPAAPP